MKKGGPGRVRRGREGEIKALIYRFTKICSANSPTIADVRLSTV